MDTPGTAPLTIPFVVLVWVVILMTINNESREMIYDVIRTALIIHIV